MRGGPAAKADFGLQSASETPGLPLWYGNPGFFALSKEAQKTLKFASETPVNH
jgi:hypothetical protein